MNQNGLLEIVDRYYFVLAGMTSLGVVKLNYHAKAMQGIIISYYEDFKRIILAGFDPSAGIYHVPTFPMWGYGWLLLITENKTLLLLFQNALALCAVCFFIRHLERRRIFSKAWQRVIKILFIIALPWYAFHSVRWPYSIAVSLFLVSFVLLTESFLEERKKTFRLVLSGVLFGLMLNFRSDYFMMPFIFATIILVRYRFRLKIFQRVLLFLGSIYTILIPWMLYSHHATGHYLLTSTNSGHVFFIGLGNLPGNRWGITPSDSDPVMLSRIERHFGNKQSSLVYDSDVFLKREFLRTIRQDPWEYLRKCLYSLKSVIKGGAYCGEFFEKPECQPNCFKNFTRMDIEFKSQPLTSLKRFGIESVVYISQIYSYYVANFTVLLSMLLLPLTVVYSVKKRSLYFSLLLASILYQVAINVFAYHMAKYTGNMLFFHFMNVILGISLIQQYIISRRSKMGINLKKSSLS